MIDGCVWALEQKPRASTAAAVFFLQFIHVSAVKRAHGAGSNAHRWLALFQALMAHGTHLHFCIGAGAELRRAIRAGSCGRPRTHQNPGTCQHQPAWCRLTRACESHHWDRPPGRRDERNAGRTATYRRAARPGTRPVQWLRPAATSPSCPECRASHGRLSRRHSSLCSVTGQNKIRVACLSLLPARALLLSAPGSCCCRTHPRENACP